eukprot:TRINITY_DN1608_c1_g1_i2.p3 TRINITY_DN1608_c1_g1~~TRINITY_DN1608_c1_g1_i2.p3  ORF type:complete len:136 (+),score=57.71 TRINITY_DN1608_c1_g1_i2:60-410(+)
MTTAVDVAKQFRIKVSALKRIKKDVIFARKEVGVEEARLAKMEAEAEPDQFRLRQQKQVVSESKVMVPDALSRLKRAAEDIEMFMEQETLLEDVAEMQEEAKQLLAEAEEIKSGEN